MAEPLKASYGPEKVKYLADLVGAEYEIDRDEFRRRALDGFEDAELMARAQLIADALAEVLPTDRGRALELVTDALRAESARTVEPEALVGMEAFRYLPLVQFVRDHGLDHFEEAMEAQYELTQRFTAEFSIRPFLVRHREATLTRLGEWTDDPSEHVRRLVSEGTRPRLPWAPRLDEFVADPTPVLALLERLVDDPSKYVRRSVANNLNDIAKDHPDLVVEVARRWWPPAATTQAEIDRRRMIRHGLRTLVKAGDRGALEVLGYGGGSSLRLASSSIEPSTVAIGGSLRCGVELANDEPGAVAALVDFRVWFVKANGSTLPKVFKGAEVEIAPGETVTVSKKVAVQQMSTRTHHPGTHRVEVLVNGDATEIGAFELTAE